MLASLQVDSFLFRLRASSADILRLILLAVVVILIPASTYGFYSIHSRLLIVATMAAFLALTFFNPVAALSALLFLSLLCGNHPGGSYLEVFDFLLLIWVLASEFLTRKSRIHSFADGYEWLFFSSCVVSILANRFLIKDIFNHTANPYFILTANETQPLYAIKMLLMTFTCISAAVIAYRLYQQRGEQVLDTLSRTIFIACSIAIAAGILEVQSATVSHWLSRMRFFIDQDFGDSAPHTILPFFRSLQGSTAAKGFFWNRGWFGIYLIATFPFVLLFLHKRAITDGSRWKMMLAVIFLAIFFYALVLIGARGAFIAFTFSIVFYFAALRSGAKFQKVFNVIPYVVLAFAALFPWSAFIDRLQPALGLRTGFFTAGFQIGFSRPLFGGGAEIFGWNNTVYLAGTAAYSSLHSPHNQMLQVFSGQGLVGIICYAALILFVIRTLNRTSSLKADYLPLMSGLIAFLIYSSFQEWFYLRSVQILWWLLIAFCCITAQKKDPANDSPRVPKWKWMIPLILLCIAPVAAALQSPPNNFGFSPSITAVQSMRWGWITGKEAWCELPPSVKRVKLQLRNFREDPFVVHVEIPSVYQTTIPFDRRTLWKILDIDLPENSGTHVLRISCDQTWSGMHFNRGDNRKLCIATHLKFIPASQ